MTFFSVLLALMIEQFRALSSANAVARLLRRHAASAGQRLDGGRIRYGLLGWLSVVVPWTLAVGIVYYLLYRVNVLLAFAWNVVVLYFTLGFRQFSHYFTDIHVALGNDDVQTARDRLHDWTDIDTIDMPVPEIVRLTLMYAVVSAHRYVFGVFFWFLIPIGPAGAVLYRIAAHLSATWTADDRATPAAGAGKFAPESANDVAAEYVFPSHATVEGRDEGAGEVGAAAPPPLPGRRAATAIPSTPVGGFARHAFFVIDWIPARLTALGFAIVGNFEDAMHAWRHRRREWSDTNEGTLLAAGSGALGARLSGPLAPASAVATPSLDPDGVPLPNAQGGLEGSASGAASAVEGECTPRTLQSAVGLVWRAVILWMILLLMVSVSIWLA